MLIALFSVYTCVEGNGTELLGFIVIKGTHYVVRHLILTPHVIVVYLFVVTRNIRPIFYLDTLPVLLDK